LLLQALVRVAFLESLQRRGEDRNAFPRVVAICTARFTLLGRVGRCSKAIHEKTDLALVKEKFKERIAVAGGVSSAVTLYGAAREEIRRAVQNAVCKLGPRGFILAQADALFPDTPWANLEAMIDAWREVR
jgi:uroporphyrinogen-III decarboxylase